MNGQLPDERLSFVANRSFESALKKIFTWFNETEETRINFGAIYHREPDVTGRI